jgi:hypothetical protein
MGVILFSGDKGEAGEKGRTGDFGFPGPQVHFFDYNRFKN